MKHFGLFIFGFCVIILFGYQISGASGPTETENEKFPRIKPNPFEKRLLETGFVDVQTIDSTLRVELKYACEDNFMQTNVYGEFKTCYLRREAAEKLARAHSILKEMHPHLRLLLLDGLRPRHVQYKMWEFVKDTPMQGYVANPHFGSMHNYGAAVDITLVDIEGNRLDMGTLPDHFGILAQPRFEEKFLKEGKLTADQVANRRLLRKVMTEAGFQTIPIEWWHFEAFDKKTIRREFNIIE